MPEIDDHLAAAAAAHRPFEIHLSGTGTFRPVSDVVFVVVAAGIAQCEQLEARVRSGPLARETRFPYHPHVTVAHDIPDEGLDRAYAGLADFDARFPVAAFTVFEQVTGGVWVTRKDLVLRGD
jgi:2'-5' RNA ligase